MPLPRVPSDAQLRSRYQGCLLGGAVGDAVGAPVELLDLDEIVRKFGEPGIRDYAPAYGKLGAITDDTQMALFTAEGMLSARLDSMLHGCDPDYFRAASSSYARWLVTQEHSLRANSGSVKPSWLLQQRKLFARRAPGTTCLSALQSKQGRISRAANDSKGCGGVMRVAPAGMYFARAYGEECRQQKRVSAIFDTGSDLAAITHGHPSGRLSAGVLTVIVSLILTDTPLPEALAMAKVALQEHELHRETLAAIEKAEALAKSRPRERAALRELGKGFVAEEALAMGLYCALSAKDFEDAIVLAVNHSGYSDSTGAIAGNIMGASAGVQSIPERWLGPLELRPAIEALADDLAAFPEWSLRKASDSEERKFYLTRYPPG